MKVLELKNVKCSGCVDSIKKGLGDLDGVRVSTVDISTGNLEFETVGSASIDAVKEKLDNLGYPVNLN